MKYIKISNAGILDENLIFLMGASTKTDDASKIGQFGTGLKYSITWLLRNNIDFRVFLGGNEIRVDTVSIKIQNDTFDVVRINGRESSITTKMGLDWKAWMILREIWCNAIDAGGESITVTDDIAPDADRTTFYIQLTGQIAEAYQQWDKYFNSREPISDKDGYRVYPSIGNDMRLYRKGILIAEYKNVPSVFDYDISDASINELREYCGYIDFDICYAFASLSARAVNYFVENISDEKKEAKVDLSYSNFSGWKDAFGDAKIISYDSYAALSAMNPEQMKDNRFIQLPGNLYKKLCKDIENISALMISSDANHFFEVLDQKLKDNINQALAILESCDYFVDAELTIITGIFNDKSVLGRINLSERVIMISTTLRDMGLKELIYTIVEETEHFRTGHGDKTREFQTHFIQLYTNTLLQKNEVKL